MGHTHVNGGMLVGRFAAVDADEVAHWFMSRNRLDEYGFFDHFLNAPDVRQALPQLGLEQVDAEHAEFTQTFAGTMTLDGELAATLVRGGAYEKYSGRAAEAKRITGAFVAFLIEDRHEDCEVYRSARAWSPWFFDVAWDTTWIIIDNRRMELTLMCVTDTD
jgi:hypothetical protein